eukprot:754696-Hanusia_phi.AAC.2
MKPDHPSLSLPLPSSALPSSALPRCLSPFLEVHERVRQLLSSTSPRLVWGPHLALEQLNPLHLSQPRALPLPPHRRRFRLPPRHLHRFCSKPSGAIDLQEPDKELAGGGRNLLGVVDALQRGAGGERGREARGRGREAKQGRGKVNDIKREEEAEASTRRGKRKEDRAGEEGQERSRHQHLIDEDPQGPPVCLLPMSEAEHDLRRHVERRADEGEAALDVTELVEENVLGLEVSEQDPHLVQVLHRQDDLCCIEDRPGLGEPLLLGEEGEQIASFDVVHHEDEAVDGPEGEAQLHDERMLNYLQRSPLRLQALHRPVSLEGRVQVYEALKVLPPLQLPLEVVFLLGVDDAILGHHLHGVHLSAVYLAHAVDLTVGPLAQGVEHREVPEGDRVVLQPQH